MRVTGFLELSRLSCLILALAAVCWAQGDSFWVRAESKSPDPTVRVFVPRSKAHSGQAHLIWTKFTGQDEPVTVRVVLGAMFKELEGFRLLGRKTLPYEAGEAEVVSFSSELEKKKLAGRLLIIRHEETVETFLLVGLKSTISNFLTPFEKLQTKVLSSGFEVGDVL